ncbi:AtuA-related protein [Micromonospora endophytica]|uniref:AtuA-like ferredoxin-fold domain-containing protein n=1 Tax=Micromonospora endophytica TaxID=515350 RepID=A0A2W2CQI4_9ACTN|nr:hypothetical protein [Micromonospora endophytica]PZG00131.1 hypothetical protein C1I93_03550 [Micromonospora endophytica]RIW42264.1 hypothetical protein D3H59_23640 [Micromonospora endophytica]BCJ61458.1 hypothetical protein Jiend_48800 [Micromonospora endophytica]
MTVVTRRLWDIAHARAGDKGDSSILLLRTYPGEDFGTLVAVLTVARVAEHFQVPADAVSITPVPRLSALTLVVRGGLAGGVTRSPRVDPHGKTLSGHLLDLRVPWPVSDRHPDVEAS